MKNISNILIFATASALLFASCAKMGTNGDGNDGAPLSFSSRAEGTVEVKGTLVSGAVTSFTAAGFDGGTPWFPETNVTTSGTYTNYKWKSGKSYTFFGYVNVQPTVAEATITSSCVQLDYNAVPESAADQQDILLGYYSGNGGGEGKAEMKFFHPLASVQFKAGNITNVESITGISIDGLYSAGQTKLLPANIDGSYATFEWEVVEDPVSVSQTTSVSKPFLSGSAIGDPFILIPQTLSEQSVTVKMTVTLSGNVTKIVSAELSTGAFVAGKTTAITVNYDGGSGLSFGTSLTAWGTAADITADNLQEGPDPDYWVDLGMVSDTGHRLYISKYNVKKENGQYVFDTEGNGDNLSSSEASAITSVSGEPCRLPSPCEWLNLFIYGSDQSENPNVSWVINSEDKSCTCTSKITGKSVTFPTPYDEGKNFAAMYYYSSDVDGIRLTSFETSGGGLTIVDNHVDIDCTRTRVVYEDMSTSYTVCSEPAPYVEINGVKYYEGDTSESKTVSLRLFDHEIKTFCTLSNNFTASNVDWQTTSIQLNSYGTMYTVYDNQIWFVATSNNNPETVNVNFLGQYTLHLVIKSRDF